jgi:nuclear GTP-binding protein
MLFDIVKPDQADLQSTHIVETEPFSNTFGPKAQRKRPRINVGSFAELGESSQAASEAKEGGTSSCLPILADC